MDKYINRYQAGQYLARELDPALFLNSKVLGLARGGVPVAFAIAEALKRPLDVFIVRKLGAPHQSELAIGAVASGGIQILNESLIKELQLSPIDVQKIVQTENAELARREKLYHPSFQENLKNQSILLVDDGIATGASVQTAIQALRHQDIRKLTLAVPVASSYAVSRLRPIVDEFICPLIPKEFSAVSLWYKHFPQITDEEVLDWLHRASKQIQNHP